ncbi:uncharacterized protein PAC_00438 [Phialocephala subalpina]|uniref:Uncharacterized protein n=1 Tax=Phialocephala subalpina TaxID=576137 RepID=A0A1L7WCP8_9HELO|nr:uncharacterized protein PAC_00438 [Phialocephala subalpina]
MAPFFDRVLLHDALQNQAVPVLEALAANDNLRNRSLRRFERDDPPPYASSTESEEFNDDFVAPPLPRGELPEELKTIMEQPITDDEMKHIAYEMRSILDPVDFYHIEAKREEIRVDKYRSHKIFRGVEGCRRCGVFVRHNVKRRWEKLGIWNREWGFAGRNVQPNDNAYRWKWRWEQTADGSESAGYARGTQREQLVARVLRLRQNLRRGENAPVLPQSCLEQDATASQFESFIISRPWFIFRIELAEERTRYYRLSVDERRRYPYSARTQVIKWWKERGDWREEFDRKNCVTSWKWRHESPSPEPEDLTPIKNMKDSPLDTMDMDFTPSEIDDLETIELPDSEQPKGFWTIWREDSGLLAPFPGQLLEPFQPPPPPPGSLLYTPPGSLPPRRSIFEKTPSEEEHDEQLLEELPRRSARIADMKLPTEPLPSQAVSNKKPRGRAAPKAAAPAAQPTTQATQRRKTRPVPACPPLKIETETRPKRGRGRPRKENGQSTRSAVTKKKAARTPALAGPGRGRAAATGTPADYLGTSRARDPGYDYGSYYQDGEPVTEGDAKEAAEKLRDELHGKVVRNHRFPGASSVPETAESSYDYEDGEDPTNQLLAEYQYDSSLQVPADNTYTLPPASSSLQIPAVDNVMTLLPRLPLQRQTMDTQLRPNRRKTHRFHLSRVKILISLMDAS